MDYSLPGFSIHGILQERIPEWAAMSSSRLWRFGLNWMINIFKVLWLKICNFAFGTITGFIVILFFLKIHIGIEFSWILMSSPPCPCTVFTLKYLNFHYFLLVLLKRRKLKPHSLVIWKNSARQMIIRIFLLSLLAFFWFSFLNLQKRGNLFSVNLNPVVLETERNT